MRRCRLCCCKLLGFPACESEAWRTQNHKPTLCAVANKFRHRNLSKLIRWPLIMQAYLQTSKRTCILLYPRQRCRSPQSTEKKPTGACEPLWSDPCCYVDARDPQRAVAQQHNSTWSDPGPCNTFTRISLINTLPGTSLHLLRCQQLPPQKNILTRLSIFRFIRKKQHFRSFSYTDRMKGMRSEAKTLKCTFVFLIFFHFHNVFSASGDDTAAAAQESRY